MLQCRTLGIVHQRRDHAHRTVGTDHRRQRQGHAVHTGGTGLHARDREHPARRIEAQDAQVHRRRTRAELGPDFFLLGEVWGGDRESLDPWFADDELDARAGRMLMELLRRSPVPVLLVKSPRPWRRR